MSQEKPSGSAVTDSCLYGTMYQRREIERWESAGWLFLQWIEAPLHVGVLVDGVGNLVMIDDHGFAWRGTTFSTAHPVPLEQYPAWGLDEWVVP